MVSLDLCTKNNIIGDNTIIKVKFLIFYQEFYHMKTKQALAAAKSTSCNSVFNFVCWPAESPVMLHCVLIGTLTHVMHTCVADGEALLHYVVHEVNP